MGSWCTSRRYKARLEDHQVSSGSHSSTVRFVKVCLKGKYLFLEIFRRVSWSKLHLFSWILQQRLNSRSVSCTLSGKSYIWTEKDNCNSYNHLRCSIVEFSFFLELFLVSFEVLDHKIFSGELIEISVMIDSLIRLQMLMMKHLSNYVSFFPKNVPIITKTELQVQNITYFSTSL